MVHPQLKPVHRMISVIRPATVADAAAISAVVIGALRESNAKDYSADIIEQVQRSFSPAAVEQLIALREGSRRISRCRAHDHHAKDIAIEAQAAQLPERTANP